MKPASVHLSTKHAVLLHRSRWRTSDAHYNRTWRITSPVRRPAGGRGVGPSLVTDGLFPTRGTGDVFNDSLYRVLGVDERARAASSARMLDTETEPKLASILLPEVFAVWQILAWRIPGLTPPNVMGRSDRMYWYAGRGLTVVVKRGRDGLIRFPVEKDTSGHPGGSEVWVTLEPYNDILRILRKIVAER